MIRNANYAETYVWDTVHADKLPPSERGNTLMIPTEFEFNYIYDQNMRLTWVDRKPGSPTFGQVRTQPSPFYKPEVVVTGPLVANDVRGNTGYANMLKAFLGWKAIGFVLYQKLIGLSIGKQYALKIPLFPDLVMAYQNNTQKIFADDPAAGMFIIRVEEGAVDLAFTKPDDTWYDGGDVRFGQWFSLEKVFTATKAEMTVGGEFYSVFGLVNSCYFFGPWSLEMVGAGTPEPLPGVPGVPSFNGMVIDSVQVTYKRP